MLTLPEALAGHLEVARTSMSDNATPAEEQKPLSAESRSASASRYYALVDAARERGLTVDERARRDASALAAASAFVTDHESSPGAGRVRAAHLRVGDRVVQIASRVVENGEALTVEAISICGSSSRGGLRINFAEDGRYCNSGISVVFTLADDDESDTVGQSDTGPDEVVEIESAGPEIDPISAMRLRVGDVILGADDNLHTITALEHYDVGRGLLCIETSTGVRLTVQGSERFDATFVVVDHDDSLPNLGADS